jgi:hypothetical protein
MPRGKPSPNGSVHVAKNKYHYTKVDGKWRLTHHLVMEKRIERPLHDYESVRFIDGDRTNLAPYNLKLVRKQEASLLHRIEAIDAKIEELRLERESLVERLREPSNLESNE